jgi:spore coat polysaccharide biosynthesis predicted glycosyltransferase SpsG
MGGIDRTGTTLKIIDSLAGWRKDIKKNIILGGGFLYIDEVRKKIKGLKGKNFRIYHNLPGIAGLLLESDFIFTAGGNTLYESACAGTPPIVLYEDEHEKENGLMFERHGFGYCLGKGLDITKSDILDAVKRFEDIKARQAHSSKGKGLVDGKGSYRILDIIERLV